MFEGHVCYTINERLIIDDLCRYWPERGGDQLHAARRLDGLVLVVGVLPDVRGGRQDPQTDLRQPHTGLRGARVRGRGPQRDLLLREPSVPCHAGTSSQVSHRGTLGTNEGLFYPTHTISYAYIMFL